MKVAIKPLNSKTRERPRILEWTALLSAIAGVGAYGQTAGPAQPDCPSTAPAFPSTTFDENNRYLANPKCRTEFLDSLKYISLRPESENYYLSFGVWVRERGEYFS